eukprot:SM004898S16928  [mRNA]  locus=s4898:30:1071:+ [translate_table: standard]
MSEDLRIRASALQGNLTSSVSKGWLTRMFGVPKSGPHTSQGGRLQADPAVHWNARVLMVLRFVHLLSFCLAFGTAVWTTYYEPVLLRQALPKSKATAGFAEPGVGVQVHVVQALILPAYFKTLYWALLKDRQKIEKEEGALAASVALDTAVASPARPSQASEPPDVIT